MLNEQKLMELERRIKLTITLDKDLLAEIDIDVEKTKYRNRSHAIEYLTKLGREADKR